MQLYMSNEACHFESSPKTPYQNKLEYARICGQMQDCIHRIIKKVIKSSGNTDISNIRSARFDFRYLPIYIANKHSR